MAFIAIFCTFLLVANADEVQDKESVFYQNFENLNGVAVKVSTVDKAAWTNIIYGKAKYSLVTDGDNTILKISTDKSVEGIVSPRLEKNLNIINPCNIDVSFKVKTCEQLFSLIMYTKKNTSSATTTLFTFDGKNVLARSPRNLLLSSDEFIDVNVKFNTHKKTYSVYFNGVKYVENASFVNGTDFTGTTTLRFTTTLRPGNAVYLDDISITTDDKEVANYSTFYECIDNVEVKTPLVPLIRESHPRIYFDSFDELRVKINSDVLAGKWYKTLKDYADSLLQTVPEDYLPVNNILTLQSRRIMYKLYVLSFVYGIEEDVAYKERAMAEIRMAGTFPSWHPNNFLGTAELTNGISVAYDWMYNGLTSEERKEIEDIIINNGIFHGVESYEGIANDFFTTAESNWNVVCNGGLLTAAVALADNYPNISEYIFQHASKSIPLCLEPTYAPQGASPEGTGYWEYATENLVHVLALLDSAIKEGETLPKQFDFSNAEGFSQTLDFPIATSSTYGTFNYGDNSVETSKKNMSTAYWLAHKYGKPQYSWYQLHMNDLLGEYGDMWKITQKLAWYSPSDLLNDSYTFPLDKAYIHSNGPNLVTMRSSWADYGETYVGMQGGSNQAPHQFLSLGTFVIDALGKRWATMRGPGNYRWESYFGDGRHNYYIGRTEGQNCVVLNPDEGLQQNDTAVAQVCAFETSDSEVFGVLDLTSAYSDEVNSYKRGVRLFDGRTKILIQDDISAKDTLQSGWWFMHTDARVFPSKDGKSAILVMGDKRLYMELLSAPEKSVITVVDAKPLPISPDPEEQKDIDYGKKIAIDISGEKDIRFSVLFVPLSDGIAPDNYNIDTKPIDEWKLDDVSVNVTSAMATSVAYLKDSNVAVQKGAKVQIDNNGTVVFEKKGNLMVPLRMTVETFGDNVSWNPVTQVVEITHLDKVITFSSDGKSYTVEDQVRYLSVPMAKVNGMNFISASDMCHILDKEFFVNDDGLVIIGKDVKNTNNLLAGQIVDLLKYRLYVDGNEIKDFSANESKTTVLIRPDIDKVANLSVTASDGSYIDVSQASSKEGSAYLQLPDRKIEIKLHTDEIYYATSDKAITKLELTDSNFKDLSGVVTWLVPVSAVASAEGAYPVAGICDNDINTLWSSQGTATVVFDFGKITNFNSLSVSCDTKNGVRAYTFDIDTSTDGNNWTRAMENVTTQPGKIGWIPEIFDMGNISARYIRLTAKGNSVNDWNLYHELRFYGSEEQRLQDANNWIDYFKLIDWNNFKVGQTLNLVVKGVCMDKTQADFTGCDIVFKSSNENVVKVNNDGLLEAIGIGEATISVEIDYHGISESTQVSIVVVE